MKRSYENRIELLQGTLDLLILQTLQWGPRHGYGISQAIRATSGEVLQVDTGSLYPALHRLERRKWIAADWKLSDNKQRVRVYRLTALCKRQLLSARSRWEQLPDAIAGVLHPVKRRSIRDSRSAAGKNFRKNCKAIYAWMKRTEWIAVNLRRKRDLQLAALSGM